MTVTPEYVSAVAKDFVQEYLSDFKSGQDYTISKNPLRITRQLSGDQSPLMPGESESDLCFSVRFKIPGKVGSSLEEITSSLELPRKYYGINVFYEQMIQYEPR